MARGGSADGNPDAHKKSEGPAVLPHQRQHDHLRSVQRYLHSELRHREPAGGGAHGRHGVLGAGGRQREQGGREVVLPVGRGAAHERQPVHGLTLYGTWYNWVV